jgi:hypothetical protein
VLSWGRQAAAWRGCGFLTDQPGKMVRAWREKAISEEVAARHSLGVDQHRRIVLSIKDEHGRPVSVERLTLPGDRFPGQQVTFPCR